MNRIILSALALTAASGLFAQKLSPGTTTFLMQKENRETSSRLLKTELPATPSTVRVFIDLFDTDAISEIEKLGGKVFTEFDGCVTAEVPVDSLVKISELEGVKYISNGSKVNLLMDRVRPNIGYNLIEENYNNTFSQPYKGEGVIIGIIDTGLEFDHVNFRDADGNLRLKRVWNQNGIGKTPEKFSYGAEYVSPDEIRSATVDTQGQYHATHVTGIATGSDKKSGYYGIAPEADIVFVSYGNDVNVGIPDALQYIFDYAESVGKPCVINMSLGSHQGPHDGTSALDRYLASTAGPGRVVVGACGNEGESKLHVSKAFTEGDTKVQTLIEVPTGSNKNAQIDIWGSKNGSFTVEVVVVDAQRGKILERSKAVTTGESESTSFYPSDDNMNCYFEIASTVDPTNEKPNAVITAIITEVPDNRAVGVVVNGKAGEEVHLYNVGTSDFVSGGLRGWTAGTNDGTVGEIGGTANDIISVGSFNTRYTFPLYNGQPGAEYSIEGMGADEFPLGEISNFSSVGPTADGRVKPDVIAPGALVVSSISKHYYGFTSFEQMVQRTIDSNNRPYYYHINVGTSMACPVVTGTIALWLQANPELSATDVREIIRHTALEDEKTGTVPNNNAGYGRINAFSGLRYALTTSGIDDIKGDSNDTEAKVWTEAGTIYCAAPATQIDVYSIAGVLMASCKSDGTLASIDASNWPAGIYIVRTSHDGNSIKLAI